MELTAGITEACVLWSPFLWLQTEVALADVEILERIERRRKWTAQEKASLLAELEAEGGKVTIVAQRHRISCCRLKPCNSPMAASSVPALCCSRQIP